MLLKKIAFSQFNLLLPGREGYNPNEARWDEMLSRTLGKRNIPLRNVECAFAT